AAGHPAPAARPGRASARLAAQSGDAPCDERGILAHAVEERRLALAQEVDADEVEPEHDGARPVALNGEPVLVERLGPREPGRVVGPEPAGEDNRSEAGQLELLGRIRLERLRVLDPRIFQAPLRHKLA